MKTLMLMLALLTGPALAQPASELDPARVAAAGALIDVVMPPARREAMIAGMMTSMSANIRQSLGDGEKALQDTRVKAIFDKYMAAQTTESAANLKAALPGMIVAMERAYARRFTVAQMTEMQAFFATPTGQLYMDQGSTIMTDPDVAAWQRNTMRGQFAKMRERVREMQLEIFKLDPPADSGD